MPTGSWQKFAPYMRNLQSIERRRGTDEGYCCCAGLCPNGDRRGYLGSLPDSSCATSNRGHSCNVVCRNRLFSVLEEEGWDVSVWCNVWQGYTSTLYTNIEAQLTTHSNDGVHSHVVQVEVAGGAIRLMPLTVFTETTADLTWQIDNPTDVARIEVYRSTASGSGFYGSAVRLTTFADSTIKVYQAIGLNPGITYFCAVRWWRLGGFQLNHQKPS